MKKYFIFIIFLLVSTSLLGQKITRVQIVQSEAVIGMKRNGEDIQKVMKPVFQQDNSILTCDSSYFYINRNSFDAFGNVHINQADTINIYSDLLNYNGNTKIAVLTNNVRMLDGKAVLTTNHLTYNMASKVGQYSEGGKIVNGPNTVTSKNGYYFSNSSDAYFRYDVRVKTPEVLINSDTLRYNSLSKIAYFYGPTHIYGKDDTLYTENGLYNTATDQAAFGKKNLYSQNSKTLTGDSLFYDRNAGFGRAVKNIIFKDTAQKVELHGDLGYYMKTNESIEVTKNAYVVFETEKDSLTKDSLWLSGDTLYSKVTTKGELYKLQRKRKAADMVNGDSVQNTLDSAGTVPPLLKADSVSKQLVKDSISVTGVTVVDSLISPKDSLSSVVEPAAKSMSEEKPPVQMSKKELRKAKRRKEKPELVVPKSEEKIAPVEKKNTQNEIDSALVRAHNRRIFVADSILKDSVRRMESDTAKIRTISVWRNVKIFKQDLQAKSDSAFFSYSDSTLRMYRMPIVWAQGSQIVADTMYMQMVNGKLDNMDMVRNAIVVNTKDSITFNQVGGKMMKGYFRNEKLDHIFVDGNAESIYFPEDTTNNQGMLRTISSRMKINFSNDSLMSVLFLKKPEMTFYPVGKLTEELKTLENFSWKPKERPRSKDDIFSQPKIYTNDKKKSTAKKPGAPVVKSAPPKPKSSVLPVQKK